MVIIGEPDKFLEELKSLMNSDTSLHDVIAERLEARKLKEVEREKALAKARQAQAKASADKPTKPTSKPTTK
jgi:hypothetical protein